MAMKDLLYRLRPAQIYIVLMLSIVYFLVQLYLSQITHALTLLVNSYHMLCNIVALSGCIITIKHCEDRRCGSQTKDCSTGRNFQSIFTKSSDNNKFIEVNEAEADRHERSLRNTFGWMRIEILTMLISGIFLGAFCFSLFVEAIQTLIHIDHQDTMHYPVVVFSLAVLGLILNVLSYLLIGGYTYHQSNLLYISPNGEVVLDPTVSGNRTVRGNRSQSKSKRKECLQSFTTGQSVSSSIQIDLTTSVRQDPIETTLKREHTFDEVVRDISSTLFVMICTVIVYFADNENITKYVDPVISIISGITLLVLSYPFMKESCFILLQTIPASIDIELFKTDLLKTFNDIESVHDLHIWQMTSSKYVSTVHILFHNPMVYVKIKDAVEDFFHNQGVTIVTIQPEFKVKSNESVVPACLIGCQSLECAPKTCCSTNDLHETVSHNNGGKHKILEKSKSARKSGSLLSLNINSLTKLRKINGSTQDIIKKSVSESYVTQIGNEVVSQNPSTNVSTTLSAANNLQAIHNSIDELIDTETTEQCSERRLNKLPSIKLALHQHMTSESIIEQEDSSLLMKVPENDLRENMQALHIDAKYETHSL